jgi:hypothetical protein
MGRNLLLLARLPRIERDGVTHRRDCECARCDAGFRPSEMERVEARRRFEERLARERVGRAVSRGLERRAAKRARMDDFVAEQVQAVDAQVAGLRAARDRGADDGRLAELVALRRAGLTLREALERIEEREALTGTDPSPRS